MKKILLALFTALPFYSVFAQNVGINTSGATPDASAILELSNNKTNGSVGFLAPYVKLTATNSASPVTSPAYGLVVFNTAIAGTAPNTVHRGYYYWNGTYWTPMSTQLVAMSEAQSVPTGFSANGSAGDAETWGFGHFSCNTSTFLPSYTLPISIISNAGEGEYYAFNTDTLYNIQFTGWTLLHAGTGVSSVTIYLLKYSIGSSSVTATNTLNGTLLGSATTANLTQANPITITYTGATYLPMVAGDVILLVAVNNNAAGTETFYMQGQLQFETNGH